MISIKGYHKIEGMGLIDDQWLEPTDWNAKPVLWIDRVTEQKDTYAVAIRDFRGESYILLIERWVDGNLIWESKHRREPIPGTNRTFFLSTIHNTLHLIEAQWRVDSIVTGPF